MKRLLILFTGGFPYGIHEPFLENEYPLYKEYFDHVLIVAPCKKGAEITRPVEDCGIEIIQDYTLSKDIRSILESIPWMLTDRMFYKELKNLFLHKGFSMRRLYDLLVVSLCGNHGAYQVCRWMKNKNEFDQVILYSYWMHISAYAAVRLDQYNKNCFYTISRAHGFDLYLERSMTGYKPFHEQMYRELDEIAPISDYGSQYLKDLYGDFGKVSVHRLGALDRNCRNPETDRTTLNIVTCSRTVRLKRLDRLVDALAQIKNYPIHWTHIGGGEIQNELEQYAACKLPANITAFFTDTVPNTEVYEIYKTQPFHVFVNVSETEGVPVSIMEAMSFGIPVIATAVGGTPELIDEGVNGWLLSKDFSDEELITRLLGIKEMSEECYVGFRNNAWIMFRKCYNAEENYRKFLRYLAKK